MDLQALHRGDAAALSEFMTAHGDAVWQLARRGFVAREGERRVWVRGVTGPRELERLGVEVWSEILRPEARQSLTGPEAAAAVVLEGARRVLLAQAESEGREVTWDEAEEEPLPTGVPDLDRGADLSGLEPPNDLEPEDLQRFEAARAELEAYASRLPARDAALLTRRLRQAEPRSAVAAGLGMSVPAVKEGERRLVRHLLHHLRRHGRVGERSEAVLLEALLAGDPRVASLPPRTAERIRETVLRRTFVDEPRPFAARARVAAIAAAVALGLYALMFFGLIPGPASDPSAEPELVLTCEAECGPGVAAQVAVRAPRGSKRVALWLRDPAGGARPLLAEDGGRAVALPVGAKVRLTPLLSRYVLPADWRPGSHELVAIFSRKRHAPAELAAHVEGTRLLPKVVTLAVPASP